jgi:hypothetical protein
MSYDLDALHQKYGLQMASVRFAQVSDLAGTTIIPGVSNQAGVIQQVTFTASSWANLSLGLSTAAGTMVWTGFAGQAAAVEQTRVLCDSGASIFAFLGSVAVTTGSGFLHVYFTYQKSGGAGLSL